MELVSLSRVFSFLTPNAAGKARNERNQPVSLIAVS